MKDLKGNQINTMTELFKAIHSWKGGSIEGDAYYTTEGYVMLEDKKFRIYRHWSNSYLPLGVYEVVNGVDGKYVGHIEHEVLNDKFHVEWGE